MVNSAGEQVDAFLGEKNRADKPISLKHKLFCLFIYQYGDKLAKTYSSSTVIADELMS